MSAYLAVYASGSVLFLFAYFSEQFGQTLFLCLGQKHLATLTTYQLLHFTTFGEKTLKIIICITFPFFFSGALKMCLSLVL